MALMSSLIFAQQSSNQKVFFENEFLIRLLQKKHLACLEIVEVVVCVCVCVCATKEITS